MKIKALRSGFITFFIVLIILLAHTAAAQEGEKAGGIPLLVDTQWLEENINLPELRIVDFGRDYEDYQSGHIQGAVFLARETVWDEVDGVSGMLPRPQMVIKELENAGIGTDKIVVIYDGSNGLWAARLFWALEYLGHRNVHLLNGGWEGWKRYGGEIGKFTTTPPRGRFTPRIRNELLATKDWILGNLENPKLKIIDTRSVKEYTGEDKRAQRGGHIPGAININWVFNIIAEEGNIFLPVDELAELYDSREVEKNDVAVTLCQTGVRGAHTYFVLRHLGYPEVKLYDGSWAEWGNANDTPFEKGEK